MRRVFCRIASWRIFMLPDNFCFKSCKRHILAANAHETPRLAKPGCSCKHTRMLYVIIARDTADSRAARNRARNAHLGRLEQLKEEARLVLAGPFPSLDTADPGDAGFTGSLIVAEFDSLETARGWAEADPYLAAGAYESVAVKPFKQVLP